MEKIFRIKQLAPAIFLLALLVSCTKSGNLGGANSSSGGTFSGTLTGSVSGGLTGVSGASVNLFQTGITTPIASAVTNSAGAFNLNYSNSATGLLYATATGGNAGAGTNSNIQLASIVGSGSSIVGSIVINEQTTAAFMQIMRNFNGYTDSSGQVTFSNVSAATASNAVFQFNNMITNGALNTGNSGLTAGLQNALNTIANAVASCVENSSKCATLFSTSANSSGGAGVSLFDSINNMMTVSTDLAPIYNLAFPLASSTGFTISSTPTSLLTQMPTTTTQIGVQSAPQQVVVDASGNLWVSNFSSGTVSKISPSGALIGNFTVGTNPFGLAIDLNGNAWVSNVGGSVIELNPAGAIQATIAMSNVWGIAIDPFGNIWISNRFGNQVTKLSSSGTVIGTFSTVSGTPYGIAFDANGDAWTADTSGTNSVTEFSNSGIMMNAITGFSAARALAFDKSGNLWVNSGSSLKEINSSGGVIGTFSTTAAPTFITFDANGNLWTTTSTQVLEVNGSGTTIANYTMPSVSGIQGVAVDQSGNFWTTDGSGSTLNKLNNVTVGPSFFPYSGPQYPNGF